MNESNSELLEGLRTLAADGPREAPGHIEEQLKAEFRRRNRRRSLMTWVPASSAAIAAGIALFLWMHVAPVQPVATTVDEDTDASFYPLPEAESLPAIENAMVVRVQLPVASLQLMGVPVDADADVSVQADFLLGQDGLARGVRLVE
jgi:hypothetical protein